MPSSWGCFPTPGSTQGFGCVSSARAGAWSAEDGLPALGRRESPRRGRGAAGRPGLPLLPWEHVDSRWTGSTVCWVGLPLVKAREAAAAFCPADVGVGGVRRGRRALGSGDYGV